MKKVLITGAAGGLGLATAKYMVENGWRVYAADYNREALEKIKEENIIPIQVDITSDEKVNDAETMRRPVIKIRPGAFKTNMQGGANVVFDKMLASTTHYRSIMEKMRTMLEKGTGNAKEPIILAKQVYRALTDETTKLAYSANINRSQKLLSSLPEKLQDRILKNTFK